MNLRTIFHRLYLAAILAVIANGRVPQVVRADEKPEPIAAKTPDKEADPATTETDEDLKTLIANVQREEQRYQNISATVRTSRDFQKPNHERASGYFGSPNSAHLVNFTTIAQQVVSKDRFQFL